MFRHYDFKSMEIKQSNKKAVVVGATGLVGSRLLSLLELSDHYEKIRVIARREPSIPISSKVEWIVNGLSNAEEYTNLVQGDDLFITLGTTMAQAGSKEAFRKIDLDLSFQIAKAGVVNGVNQLLLVTAVGADPDSLFFYNRVKGELEQAVLALPFWAVHIFRPSILLGERNESRPVEHVAQYLSRGLDVLGGRWFGRYKPVEASAVAASMIHFSSQLKPGQFFHPSDEISTFGASNILPSR